MITGSASLLTAVAALAAVLGLIWLAGRVARLTGLSRRPIGSGRLLSVVDVVALDSRRRLHVVRCADAQVVLLTGAGQDLVVGWIAPAASEPARQ